MEDDINSSTKISSKETKNNQNEEYINTYNELKNQKVIFQKKILKIINLIIVKI